MHALFATRGKKQCVDQFIGDLMAQKYALPFTDNKGKKMKMYIDGNLQPIQLWSYVFPEEEKDVVLTTLDFDKPLRYENTFKTRMSLAALNKALGGSKIPKFDTSKKLLWAKENVSIVPIGVRYDIKDWKDPNGTTHEAI